MTYVQFATGFKGGGISPRPFSAAQAVPFDPEKLKSYELGVKSDLFDRRMRVNASVFFSDYSGPAADAVAPARNMAVGLPCAVVANAGDAEIKGAELETEMRPHRAPVHRRVVQLSGLQIHEHQSGRGRPDSAHRAAVRHAPGIRAKDEMECGRAV